MLTFLLTTLSLFQCGISPESLHLNLEHRKVKLEEINEEATVTKSDDGTMSTMRNIANACNWLTREGAGTRSFVDKVLEKRSQAFTTSTAPFLIITKPMAENPYLIAQALIDMLLDCYPHQDAEEQGLLSDQGRAAVEVSQLLNYIQEFPTKADFENLYFLLRRIFGGNSIAEHDLRSPYGFIFYWCFYNEKVRWISRGTLSILTTLGEGDRSVIFRVQSDNRFSPQIFALKMYKNPSDWSLCINEERIMRQISRHNALFNSLGLDSQIAVPAVFASIEGVVIDCILHNAFLMEYVDGFSLRQLRGRLPERSFTADDADDMYIELKNTIDLLFGIGILHNDITFGNVMVDSNGKYWLINFSRATSTLYDDSNPPHKLLGAWTTYSPHLHVVNEKLLMNLSNITMSTHGIQRLAYSGNIYSLQVTVLHQMLWREAASGMKSFRFYHRLMKEMCIEINDIYKRRDSNRMKMITKPLQLLWSLRATFVRNHMEQHPEQRYLLQNTFSKLILQEQDDLIELNNSLLLDEFREDDPHNDSIAFYTGCAL